MDLSTYYQEYQTVCNIALVAIILYFLVTVFLCIRAVRDKSRECNRTWKKVAFCAGYIFLFFVVVSYYFIGPYRMGQDVEQKTIYYYEGSFEITETTDGILNNEAVFLIDGQEVCLKYYDNDEEAEVIGQGRYEGKIVYAQHAADILYLEIIVPEQ